MWARLFVALLVVLSAVAVAAPPRVQVLERAEAVRGGWNATEPPVQGWTPVRLMDFWTARWPHHDGVVWYRLRWHQSDVDTPVGLLVEYVCLADAVYVNGSLVHRDPQLVEPLSRSWVQPQYVLLDTPLLRAGENTLLVRVSGLAAYQPGFGRVLVGDPAVVHARYRSEMRWRYDVRLFNFAISAVLGVLFFMLWMLRRKDTVYGWYALTTLFGAGYSWSYVAADPWPFGNTDAWQAFVIALLMASVACFAVFLLRFCERRWPRTERAMGLVCVAAFACALLVPHWMGPWRNLWALPTILAFYAMNALFIAYAVRRRRADVRVLGVCLLLPMLLSFRDFALYLGLIRSDIYLGALASLLTLVGMGFALAWRHAAAMRRVEGFNAELRREVDSATARLGETLAHEHELALANTRIGERLHLVRDLHDGFGGSLLGAIAELERHPSPHAERSLRTLKELRDDLRLVIDTTTHEGDTDMAGLLAPLRHRWSQRFEAAGIAARWRVEGLDGLHLGATRSLDLLRFLQEALTNALKHSGAADVRVSVCADGASASVRVDDDGRGFQPPATSTGGAGLDSLRARARRLAGIFALRSSPGGGCTVRIEGIPIGPGGAAEVP